MLKVSTTIIENNNMTSREIQDISNGDALVATITTDYDKKTIDFILFDKKENSQLKKLLIYLHELNKNEVNELYTNGKLTIEI